MAQDIKSRLSAYREKKAKEQEEQKELPVPVDGGSKSKTLASNPGLTPDNQRRESSGTQDGFTDQPSPSPWYMKVLKVSLWLILWRFFIEVEFGIVFVVTSALYFLYTSLWGSRRKPWEPSAYSVFNKDCEAIDGTLSADQFERELRLGPAAVRR